MTPLDTDTLSVVYSQVRTLRNDPSATVSDVLDLLEMVTRQLVEASLQHITCTCGYGGQHEPENNRCFRTRTIKEALDRY